MPGSSEADLPFIVTVLHTKHQWPSHGSSSSLLSAPLQSLLYTELLTLFFMWKQILAIKNIGSKSSPLPIRNIYMEWNTRKRFCYMDNFFYKNRLYWFLCKIYSIEGWLVLTPLINSLFMLNLLVMLLPLEPKLLPCQPAMLIGNLLSKGLLITPYLIDNS